MSLDFLNSDALLCLAASSPSINIIYHTSPPGEKDDDICNCTPQSSIPFLDVLCSIKDGRIETDLYRKDTDRNMYLLPSSCHPPACTKNIPFSLCLRIVRICSKPEDREKQFLKLKELMENRGVF